ncbi:MAG: hypothetical protein WD423_08325 [Rhodothermales bacterium]
MSIRVLGRILSAGFILLACSGCASVQTVETHGGDASFNQLNRAVKGKVVRVRLLDGSEMNVVGVQVDADSLSWLDREANTLVAISTGDVAEISVVKTESGALRGLLVGAIAGAVAGGVRAAAEGDDPNMGADPLAKTRDEKLRIYPAAHAVYAVLVTTPVGAILGTRQIYRVERGGLVVVP